MRILLFVLLTTSFLISCTKNDSKSLNFPGYKVLKVEQVETIDSRLVQMEHRKSGARVVLIQNDDQARSFMAGFRTPPYDDTGLFHIFEHGVLEGSRLYPSKSNFFNLAHSSVASFINAMTGPVYTLYPFVTRSPKDFDNLLSVYMDAVFFPKVLEDPRIIKREGWRYEINPKGELSINGIVLSEMKGAFASPYRSLFFNLSRALIPDTPFAYSSGGLPEKVATLTFKQIQEAHAKYYHPQNSVIYLYGDLDYQKSLSQIDEMFLAEFNRSDSYKQPEIQIQKDFNYKTPMVEATFPGQPGKKKSFIALGYVFGENMTPADEDAASVMIQAFVENNAAPLKLRVLKEGLATSTFNASFGGRDNGVSLVFEGTDPENKDKIAKVIDEEINKVVQNGFDKDLLTSILNRYEFSFKEKNSNGSHKGMQLGSIVLNNWIYQQTPLAEDLDFVTRFKKIRKLLSDQEYIKSFFKTYFQENTKKRWVVLTPDPDFSKKFNAGLDKQIQDALKEKPLEEWKKEDDIFKKWVASKESDEIVKKTPTLELSDIKADEPAIKFEKSSIGSTELLAYPQETSGISYVNLYFDLQGVEEKNLKNLDFFTGFIKKTDTKNYSFKDLSKEIDTYVGGLGFGYSAYQSHKDPQKFKPTLTLSFRFIEENREKTMTLVNELLTNNKFSPVDRLQNLIDEYKTNMVSGITYRAPSLSASAATKSFFPTLGAFGDETGGGVFENYIKKNPLKASEITKELNKISDQVFNQDRLFLVAVTASPSDIKKVSESLKQLKAQLPNTKSADQTWSFKNQPSFDGYAIPGEVQYVSQVTSYKKQGMDYDGAMKVFSSYLNNQYMTPKLREQAGAYGGGSSFSKTGLFKMTTYKDPNLKKSLDIFSGALDFIKNEKLDAEKLKPAILGSLKTYYRDKSVYGKTSAMTWLYLTDQTWSDYMKTKKEIISTTPEKIQKIATTLEEALKESKKSVAGNPVKMKEEANFLKNILNLQ